MRGYFANCTSLASSAMAEGAVSGKRSYLFSVLSPSVHFVANVETKLRDRNLALLRKQAHGAGFRSYANPAVPTEKGGVSGGEWILAKKHLSISPSTRETVGPHWRGIFLRFSRRDVLVVTVYLESGQDPHSDVNSFRLARLAAFLLTVKAPWFVVGDWNATPAQMHSTSFVQAVKGVIVVPQNAAFTCWGQGTPSLLDYVICSRSLYGVVKVTADLDGVWPSKCVPTPFQQGRS